MKSLIMSFCILLLVSANIFSQKLDEDSSTRVDTGSVTVDGGKLFYEIAGSGDYIVLLHDGILHREVWDDQFLVFAKKYRVVRYDRRGYGKSTFPKAPFSHIEDLNQLFLQLKTDKAIVFGMSGGGKLAIDFSLKYPEKVSALILVGAVVSGYGSFDLYISFKNSNGDWGAAKNMGSSINTQYEESSPSVSPDKKYLFFKSDRLGERNPFIVDANVLDNLK